MMPTNKGCKCVDTVTRAKAWSIHAYTRGNVHLSLSKCVDGCFSTLQGPDERLDSLTGVEFKGAVDAEFGIELPNTVAFDYPTVAALSEKVWRDLGGGAELVAESEATAANMGSASTLRSLATAAAATASVTVMVTGCSFVTPMPQGQRGVSAVSDRPPSGDSVSGVPLERWHTERCRDFYFEDLDTATSMMTGFAGFMAHMDLFDAALFGLPRMEATVMDPQHRSLLEGMLHARASTSLAARGRAVQIEFGDAS